MNQGNKKILMVFIEPTPYILDLLEKGFSHIKNQIDIVFLAENLTQKWDLKSYSIGFNVLRLKKQTFFLLFNIFLARRYRLLHIAGWSRLLTVFLIIASRFFFIPVTVETDTPLNSNTPLWKKIIKKCFYPILFKFPALFLPGGTRQAGYLSFYGVNKNKIINAQMTVDVLYIKNFVDNISFFEKEKCRLENGALKEDVVFLYVGRLLDWKGIRELIAAMEIVQDLRVKLWIVGSGELLNEVELAAQRNKNIVYLDRISGDLLWHIYNAADVFVLPSYWEPWGLVVNEAMAAGKPVIVTETVGCVDDFVFQNRTGLIIPPKNSNALASAMQYMQENEIESNQMAENAKIHIANWTLQNEARNMIAAWEKCN